MPKPEKRHVFDNPRNVKRLIFALYAACALVLGLELLVERHVTYPWEGLFGFYAIFGLVACIFLVLAAKEMRKLVRRPEDYYDD